MSDFTQGSYRLGRGRAVALPHDDYPPQGVPLYAQVERDIIHQEMVDQGLLMDVEDPELDRLQDGCHV